jgi:hypothetical protein
MAPSAKPPTSLKLGIQILGNAEQRLDLFAKLEELGFIERSQDIVLNVGYYFEEDGRAARDKAEALLRDHPAVMKTKSFTDLGTKRKVSDTFEAEPEAEGGEEDDDETPLERYAREQGEVGGDVIGEFAQHHGVEKVTISALGKTVELTPETRERAADLLRRSITGE